MRAIVKEIEVPMTWESRDDWDSHKPLLYLTLSMTEGPVTELGCGFGSTKQLGKKCRKDGRLFFSYETNRDWAKRFDNVTPVNDYMQVHLSDYPYRQGVIFIDNSPGELRKKLIAKHAHHGDVLVIHDTEDGAEYVYGMAEILSTFKYRLDYEPEGKPHTTIVSNFIEVHKWKDHPSCI